LKSTHLSIGQSYPENSYFFVDFLNQVFDFENVTSVMALFIGLISEFQAKQQVFIFNSNFNY